MKTSLDDLKEDILNGHYDGQFSKVSEWMKIRIKANRAAVVADIKAEIRPGFKMVTHGLRGGINDHVVTVKEVLQTKAWVVFDDATATKYGSRQVKVPLSCLKWLRE